MEDKETHVHVNHDTGYRSVITRTEDAAGNVRLQGVVEGLTIEGLGEDGVWYASPSRPRTPAPEATR